MQKDQNSERVEVQVSLRRQLMENEELQKKIGGSGLREEVWEQIFLKRINRMCCHFKWHGAVIEKLRLNIIKIRLLP